MTKMNRAAKIAFFAARHMFNDIAELAEGEKCRMTAYVDDVTISGPATTKKLPGEVRKVVSRYGYKTKQKKSKTYVATSVKVVTGAVVVGRELRPPSERHRKIRQTKQELLRCGRDKKASLMRALRGRLQAGSQILDNPGGSRVIRIDDAGVVAARRLRSADSFAEQRKRAQLALSPFCIWWRIRDSNPGPADYDSVALTD